MRGAEGGGQGPCLRLCRLPFHATSFASLSFLRSLCASLGRPKLFHLPFGCRSPNIPPSPPRSLGSLSFCGLFPFLHRPRLNPKEGHRTMSTTVWLFMNSKTPSLAMTRNSTLGSRRRIDTSGSAHTPMRSAAAGGDGQGGGASAGGEKGELGKAKSTRVESWRPGDREEEREVGVGRH